MAKSSTLKHIGKWLFTVCRVVVGLLVMKAGIDLMMGGIFAGYNRQDSLLAGGFVTVIGLYFICSSLFNIFFNDDR